jgi:hypothetical protein
MTSTWRGSSSSTPSRFSRRRSRSSRIRGRGSKTISLCQVNQGIHEQCRWFLRGLILRRRRGPDPAVAGVGHILVRWCPRLPQKRTICRALFLGSGNNSRSDRCRSHHPALGFAQTIRSTASNPQSGCGRVSLRLAGPTTRASSGGSTAAIRPD